MNTNHTNGKWVVDVRDAEFGSNIGTIIATVFDSKGHEVMIGLEYDYADGNVNGEANAARIVDCVNACAGINPDAVPGILEALRRVAALNQNAGEIGAGMLMTIVTEARAALAKAEA